jgi:hypothetical protein
VSVAVKPALDPDSARLAELGYDQELTRSLRIFDNAETETPGHPGAGPGCPLC